MAVQPSNASGGNTRKQISQGRGFPSRRVQVSQAMHREHGTSRKGSKRMSWFMTSGRK